MRHALKRSLATALGIASGSWLLAARAEPPRPAPPSPAAATPAPAPIKGTLAAGLEAAKATDYDRAEKELLAVHGPDRSAAMLALAKVMFEQGKFADAEKYASQANGTAAHKLEALALRARVLHAQGKTAEAIKLLDPRKDESGVGGRRVRLALGEMLIATGKRQDAEPVLMKFADEYGDDSINSQDAEGLAMVGRAMHLLRSLKDANKAYNESERADHQSASSGPGSGGRVETLLWRAQLFLDAYDAGHAEEVLREALKIAPHKAEALMLMARVKLDQAYDFDAAEKLTKEALAINPKLTSAYAVRAGLALRDLDTDAAEKALAQGFALDPNDLELWSMKGATRFLADDRSGYEAAKKEALARNPSYSQFFGIVGDFAEWEHRYDDILGMMKEAVQVDPKDGKAWAQLGLTQMRSGDEDEGKKSLETAWKYDKFNVRAFNTLERLYGQWIPQGYDLVETGHFKIRYPKKEHKVLERYVPRFMNEAWGAMKMRYDFAPQTPVQVELYSDRQHFSVRTSGLPNIGIQGVCFGHVLAAMSPQSEPFNWGNVVWHELGHVFAIQLSKNHVPRWFTEGLSEYETIIRRPEWQRELDPDFYRAISKGVLPGAVDMNRAFTHASDELDVTVAYYAASQMIVFTADTFGMGSITKALSLWGEGKRTADVIQQAFGVTPAEYDRRFREWAMNRLARYKSQFVFDLRPKPLDDAKDLAQKNPTSAAAHVDYALSLLRAHKGEEAKKEIDEALATEPGNMNAHYLASKIARAKKDRAGQRQHLDAIRKAGGDGYAIELEIADLAEDAKDRPAMRAALEAAYRFDPTQSEPLKGLYDMATEDKRDSDALDLLRRIAKLEQHDRRVWRTLLESLVDKKLWAEAKKVGESALYVDVESAPVHVAYAKALAATGDHEQAAFELESALLCDIKDKDAANAHALFARELKATGDAARARQERDEALRLDPQNAEAKALKL